MCWHLCVSHVQLLTFIKGFSIITQSITALSLMLFSLLIPLSIIQCQPCALWLCSPLTSPLMEHFGPELDYTLQHALCLSSYTCWEHWWSGSAGWEVLSTHPGFLHPAAVWLTGTCTPYGQKEELVLQRCHNDLHSSATVKTNLNATSWHWTSDFHSKTKHS